MCKEARDNAHKYDGTGKLFKLIVRNDAISPQYPEPLVGEIPFFRISDPKPLLTPLSPSAADPPQIVPPQLQQPIESYPSYHPTLPLTHTVPLVQPLVQPLLQPLLQPPPQPPALPTANPLLPVCAAVGGASAWTVNGLEEHGAPDATAAPDEPAAVVAGGAGDNKCAYERQRDENIRKNMEILVGLGIDKTTNQVGAHAPRPTPHAPPPHVHTCGVFS